MQSEENKSRIIGPDFRGGIGERLIYAIHSAILGFIISQYYPIFGGLRTLAEPFSPAKLNLAPGYMLIFGFLGYILAYLKQK